MAMRGSEWTQAAGTTATAIWIATWVGVGVLVLGGITAGALVTRCAMKRVDGADRSGP
jgi:hypothetical protein